MAVTRKESRRRQPGQRMSERYSGEYSLCEFDIASDCRSSEDTLTPLSTSPRSASPSSASTVTLEGDMSLLNRTLEGDTTLTDSQDVVEYGRETAGASHIMMQKPSLPKQEYSKLGMIMRGEITSSNSNDSGIQHDVNIGSSESLKIPPEIASHLTSTVKLRNSPSPKQERPKSDFTVRWADLLEQVKETNVTYRREGNKLRKRPRPKSDLEDSCEDEGLEYDSTSSEEGGSSLLTDPILRPFGVGATGPLGPGTLGAGPSLQQCDSILSLVELRRPGNRGRLDAAALQAAKLAKSRRMSTPQPIKSRTEKIVPRSQRRTPIVRSHSMPENLDRLHRKKNYLSLIGSDMHAHHRSSGVEDDSSDESEFSVDYNQEKSLSTRASRATLVTLDQMIEEENFTYAEALWDHVTMDPDELGFRAGDLVRVTDMSEKHWWYGSTENRGGWFPASFVRLRVNQDGLEAEMTLQLQEEEELQQQQLQQQPLLTTSTSKTQFRANVVNEIISAEKEYVKHLHDVIEGYVKQARKRPEMFPSEKVNIIFGNIEEIYEFATKLYSDLEKVVNTEHPHLTEFGHCFLDKTQGFEIYSEYCNNHPAACEELRVLYRAKQYRHFFEACRLLQEMTEIPLEGFLLTPVQKICKYHLQLAELLKYTPADHPDFNNVQAAVEEMKKIAKLVNERKRKMESIEKLAGWQMLVDDWEGPDILEGSSELIYSGELNKINANGWSQERYFFLFDHQLVYCKKDLLKKNSFGYKGRVNIDQSEIFNIPDGKDPQYNVNVRNAIKIHDKSRNKWFLMVAKSAQIKQRWIKAFADERRRVHDDQENNFNIPLRLKQSVIANLKQKANLSKSKGKRKVSRTSSMRTAKHDSWFSTSATLPRPSRKSSSSHQSGPTQQSNKLMSFLLGTKKKS
ncbi:rho guanine nucleotide exchange factor 4-like isoform X2 [Pomacea canaliculata]|uniref:rho guanine nucleotide exchange factor 4-like isoform X2 n=1 Tax=Pomacea canaliculata TaxID=400727 RepID=UPI000D73AB15|nr:rho guanine nucleotide exchange factor 4-like isoform X2 [Pomacea canaliculata]